MKYELEDYAKTLHDIPLEKVKAMAEEAAEILNADVSVRTSPLGMHIYVDMVLDGKEYTIAPNDMGELITNGQEMANALMKEYNSLERSRAYVRGEIDGTVFENKYKPQGIEEEYNPAMFEKEEPEEEEDRSY